MLNYKYILAAGTAMLIPYSVFADTCASLPDCASIGFTFSASDCGTLKKLKCPFGDKYFCSKTNCKAVTVNYNQKCTKYCEEDSSICVAADYTSCSAAISASGGRMIADGATSLGTVTQDLYLMGSVETKYQSGYSSSNEFNGTQKTINVYDAGKKFPICKTEMGDKTASLKMHTFTGKGSINFNVPTTISSLNYYNDVSLYFNADSNLSINGRVTSGSSYSNTFARIYLSGYNYYNNSGTTYPLNKHRVKLYCTDTMGGDDNCATFSSCQYQCGVSIEGLGYNDEVHQDTKICIESSMTISNTSVGYNQKYMTPPTIDCDNGQYYNTNELYKNCGNKVEVGYCSWY